MTDRRHKDVNWTIDTLPTGRVAHADAVLAVQMDIRDEVKQITRELRRLNDVIQCSNFISIPHVLSGIRRNTAKPRKQKA